MTLIAPQPIVSRSSPVPVPRKGSRLLDLLRTTDHKTIGLMYLYTSFLYFFAGGFMALLMRAELGHGALRRRPRRGGTRGSALRRRTNGPTRQSECRPSDTVSPQCFCSSGHRGG